MGLKHSSPPKDSRMQEDQPSTQAPVEIDEYPAAGTHSTECVRCEWLSQHSRLQHIAKRESFVQHYGDFVKAIEEALDKLNIPPELRKLIQDFTPFETGVHLAIDADIYGRFDRVKICKDWFQLEFQRGHSHYLFRSLFVVLIGAANSGKVSIAETCNGKLFGQTRYSRKPVSVQFSTDSFFYSKLLLIVRMLRLSESGIEGVNDTRFESPTTKTDTAAMKTLRKVCVFMVVFSVASECALEEIRGALDVIREAKKRPLRTIPIVFVASKCDLPETEWKVSADFSEIKAMCDEFNAPLVPTSAKCKQNVFTLFHTGFQEYWYKSSLFGDSSRKRAKKK